MTRDADRNGRARHSGVGARPAAPVRPHAPEAPPDPEHWNTAWKTAELLRGICRHQGELDDFIAEHFPEARRRGCDLASLETVPYPYAALLRRFIGSHGEGGWEAGAVDWRLIRGALLRCYPTVAREIARR